MRLPRIYWNHGADLRVVQLLLGTPIFQPPRYIHISPSNDSNNCTPFIIHGAEFQNIMANTTPDTRNPHSKLRTSPSRATSTLRRPWRRFVCSALLNLPEHAVIKPWSWKTKTPSHCSYSCMAIATSRPNNLALATDNRQIHRCKPDVAQKHWLPGRRYIAFRHTQATTRVYRAEAFLIYR